MKLNADIIYTKMKENYPVKIYGERETALSLKRPEFHMDDDTHFLAGHLYLATAEHLPSRPHLEKGAVLVCIGEPVRMKYYTDRITMIIVQGRRDFFSVYQSVQKIFDHYDQWNDALFEIFQQDADIQKIAELSAVYLEHSVCVLDSSFHILAAGYGNGSSRSRKLGKTGDSLSQADLEEFLTYGEMSTDIREPMLLDIGGDFALAVNLFDRAGQYAGCFFMSGDGRPFHSGDTALAAYLGSLLEKSLERNPALLSNERNTIRQILREIIEERPIRPVHKSVLQAVQMKTRYVCISAHIITRYSQIPASYICNLFEKNFPGSAAFPHNQSVAAFIDLKPLYDRDGKYQEQLNLRLDPMLKALKLYAGISNDFSNLYDARMHYLQAEIALENGQLTMSSSSRFYFSSFVLMEMITNSTGGMPVEMFYSNGLKNLFRHDKHSQVSYFETLKVFLEENMNYTSTAEVLYIHRSTLVDRINRIERELGIDLKDYNERLHLQIIMKALELREILKGSEK